MLLVTKMGPSSSERPQQENAIPDTEVSRLANQRWREYFDTYVKLGDSVSAIESLMKDAYRDKGTGYLGGSGSRELYFLIDDYIQVSFVVSGEDRLIRSPAITRAGKWLKRPKGELVEP
jgi:hypothetical protein